MQVITNPNHVYRIKAWLAGAFCLVAAGIVLLNVLLVRQNRSLKNQLAERPPAWRPPVGAVISPIKGVDLNGQTVLLNWGADTRDTFLFVFSPHCAVCTQTWPTWRALAGSAQATRHRLVYVNMLPPLKEDYVKKWGLENSIVIAELDPQSIAAANIRMTPEVIRLSSSGKIEQAWIGRPEGDDLATLEVALTK